ncbi:hypothetical protein ACP70R_020552 [Stipagrostis hirtigluma subsp. patula]
MAPTRYAAFNAVAPSPSPRKRIIGERNNDMLQHHHVPSSSANLAHSKPRGQLPPHEEDMGAPRRLRLSLNGAPSPPPAAAPPPSHGARLAFGGEADEEERVEDPVRTTNPHHQHHAAAAPYDPKTNYLSAHRQAVLRASLDEIPQSTMKRRRLLQEAAITAAAFELRFMVIYSCDRPTTLEWFKSSGNFRTRGTSSRCLRSSTLLGCAGRMLEAEESTGLSESSSLARVTMNIHHDIVLQDVKAAYWALARKKGYATTQSGFVPPFNPIELF